MHHTESDRGHPAQTPSSRRLCAVPHQRRSRCCGCSPQILQGPTTRRPLALTLTLGLMAGMRRGRSSAGHGRGSGRGRGLTRRTRPSCRAHEHWHRRLPAALVNCTPAPFNSARARPPSPPHTTPTASSPIRAGLPRTPNGTPTPSGPSAPGPGQSVRNGRPSGQKLKCINILYGRDPPPNPAPGESAGFLEPKMAPFATGTNVTSRNVTHLEQQVDFWLHPLR